MKPLVFVACAAVAAAVGVAWFQGQPRTARAAEPERIALLIRFGMDDAKDVDWSGSIEPAPARLSSWQFDAQDLAEAARWKCTTRRQRYWDTPYERRMGPTSQLDKVTRKGVVVEYEASTVRTIQVRTSQGDFSFEPDGSLWTAPRRFLGGRVEVSAAPATATVTGPSEDEDFPSMIESRDGKLWMAYQSFTAGAPGTGGDQIFVRRRVTGVWSKPEPVATAGGDYYRTALAEDGAGRIWVVWSAQVKGDFDLYARRFDGRRWSAIERLTDAPGPDIYHALTRDRAGNLSLVWQSARHGNFDIYLRVFDGKSWSREQQVSSDAANDWEPAVAAAPDGSVAILWDSYARGNYDVLARTWRRGALGEIAPIAASGAFEARSSAQYDAKGRLWIAFEEGDWNWGKDYGQDIPESGRGLLVRRNIRVAILDGGKLLEPSARLADALPPEFRQAFVQPRLTFDRGGNLFVLFRYRVNLPQARGERTYRGLWKLGATSLRNGQWTQAIEFPEGYGRIDAPAALALSRDGNLYTAWTTDGRRWPIGHPDVQDLMFSRIPSGTAGAEPALAAFAPSAENLPLSHSAETKDVARVRAYRVQTGARSLRIVRGDIHRHTDISWDGNRDGSLDDSYRYALDAASMDYLGVCDHQAGNMVPYSWWMIQKAVDRFTIPGRFIPLYSYERSLPYPNGHRNVLFAERGRPVLAIPEAEQRGNEGAARLYQYLRRLGGVTSSHTSATGAGTDWRDNDAELEPVVEIYQGYRRNYEGPGTPRAPRAGEEAKFSAGFVWNAWAKGIKMGVQSSSDHVSTHISYASFYVDRMDRRAILEAAKARRSFASTDNLIVDLRLGGHFMGESFRTSESPPIHVYAAGTGDIQRVELIRNNRAIYTFPGNGPEARFTFTDADRKTGEFYYYIRVEQKDGQLGWSAPVWVTYE
ncbi:MAG: hypothetical protein ACRD8O_16425 [Bryobacteraceae bacterium]